MPQGMGPSQQTKRLPVRRLVSSLCTHGDHATSTFRPRIPVCSRRALRLLVGMCAHVSLWACARAGSQAHSGLKCGFAPRCDEGIRGPPRRALRERGQRPVVLPQPPSSASPVLPPPHAPAGPGALLLLRQSLRVLQQEEGSGLTDASALAAAHLCFPRGGKEQCRGVSSPWGNAGVGRRLPGAAQISRVAFSGCT